MKRINKKSKEWDERKDELEPKTVDSQTLPGKQSQAFPELIQLL